MQAAGYATYLASPERRLRCERFWSNPVDWLDNRPLGPALDVGRGPGELAARLVAHGFAMTLLDADAEMTRSS